MKKITSRQLMIFYCIYSFAIKFLMLPQLLSERAGADAWISAAVGTVLELVMLFIVLQVLSMQRDTDIYSGLRKNVRPAGAKVVMGFILALFLLQIFILTRQAYSLLNDNLFDNLSPRLFAIPMLVLAVFFCFMHPKAFFRGGEIFYVFIIIGVALSVFPALGQIQPAEVLPVGANGASSIFGGAFRNLIYFESAAFLVMFAGDVEITKHFRKKFITLAGVIGGLFVFFVFMFYALFGPLAPTKSLAIANFTLYSSYLTQGGRLDWVLICIWLLLLILRFCVTFYCAFACVRYITGVKNRAGVIAAALAVFIYTISITVFKSQTMLGAFTDGAAWVILVLYIAIPVGLYVNALVNKKVSRHPRH